MRCTHIDECKQKIAHNLISFCQGAFPIWYQNACFEYSDLEYESANRELCKNAEKKLPKEWLK